MISHSRIKMRSAEKLIHFAQIAASFGLGAAYFLPLYETRGLLGRIHYAGSEWWLYFWAIPVSIIIYKLSNRWLKLIFCVLSSLGGLAAWGMLYFMANFKSTPLSGFFLAQNSIYALIFCWFVICVTTFIKPKTTESD